MTTRMCDLSPDLVGEEIFTRIPVTSLGAVRSTCKLWESLSKNSILGKKAEQFLGFMTIDSKICSLRFDLRQVMDVEVDISINEVESLDEFDISKIFKCDGLLLLVTKDNSRLLVWNPYLVQTMCIEPKINFHKLDTYALGYEYDKNKTKCNHKILRFLDNYLNGSEHVFGYEIYDLSSNL
ncbi:hypothetical protein AALP_AA8G091400 [Arabis alpina]|uniref:Uncharacterized protein n=1 Tax=Arabis alpina TaxID=50452 RepID=A0A087G5X8_ARAAL|nr:hypothetical protein AALP_AA8G091400 [Arabis alpina]